MHGLSAANMSSSSNNTNRDRGGPPSKKKSRRGGDSSGPKRRCVSTACIACRRRKSKCDGALPSCAACASVYGTECIYDPNSDHRRKGVYREKSDSMKASDSTLQILIEAILNADEDDVVDVVKQIRTCDSLDALAESFLSQESQAAAPQGQTLWEEDDYTQEMPVEGERDLARKMGELRLENGSMRFIGGTSHLIHWDVTGSPNHDNQTLDLDALDVDPITSWSDVDKDPNVVTHLLNCYFTWHYPYFTTLSRNLFYRDFLWGKSHAALNSTAYCSSLLVNAMLALGCHFTSATSAYAKIGDSWSKGDHFFAEAKRLIIDNDEYEKPRLTTVQALALMSVREAGCGREAKGWVYSGMSFRMAQDLGLNMDLGGIRGNGEILDELEIDARRVTFWGCFLFDKCWSNYLGRLPQIPKNSYSVPKYDVFPDEDAESWYPYTDSGFDQGVKQPSRTRTVGLQVSKLCEISGDLLIFFYHPNHIGRSNGKSVELKKLSELHRRLEEWHKRLPTELKAKDGSLPNVILMHMFFHLQYIHLFRPFLRYTPKNSPLPQHVSPRRICTANAGAISKLMRLYKKTYNLRQICNIAVYMLHSACTIHLLNLPEKTARRDIVHGVKHLEEIAEDWLCGRRTLSIISVLSRKWNVDLPDEAAQLLQRTDERWGTFNTSDVPSPRSQMTSATTSSPSLRHDSQSPAAFTMPSPGTTSPPTAAMHRTSMSPDLMNTVVGASSAPYTPPTQMSEQMMNNSVVMGNDFPMDFSTLDSASWSSQGLNGSLPNYHQSFAATNPQRPAGMMAATQQRAASAPTSVYAVDGQDWYLKDSVSWQSGFDAWNMGSTTAPSTVGLSDSQIFMFGTSGAGPANPATTAATQSPPTAMALDFNFDSLATMDGWDLSNLE